MFSCILRPYSRLNAKNSYPNSDVSLSNWTVPGEWYPILYQNYLISITYPRLTYSKTLPFTPAHTYIANIWECPIYIILLFNKFGRCPYMVTIKRVYIQFWDTFGKIRYLCDFSMLGQMRYEKCHLSLLSQFKWDICLLWACWAKWHSCVIWAGWAKWKCWVIWVSWAKWDIWVIWACWAKWGIWMIGACWAKWDIWMIWACWGKWKISIFWAG